MCDSGVALAADTAGSHFTNPASHPPGAVFQTREVRQNLNRRSTLMIKVRFVRSGKVRANVSRCSYTPRITRSRQILPSQADVRRDGIAARVVLQERADEHQGRHRVGDARADQARGERTRREVDPVDREGGFQREFRRHPYPPPGGHRVSCAGRRKRCHARPSGRHTAAGVGRS